MPNDAVAQMPVPLGLSTDPIPEEFDSWSLFLICNPAWLLPQSEEDISALYDQFLAFGNAIGPRHAAIWFWNNPDISQPHSAVDYLRNAAWCDALDLTLNESPHVVIMTDYPGPGLPDQHPESFNAPEARVEISLNNANAMETTELLTEWAQRILDDRVFDEETNTETFLSGWQALFLALRDTVLGVSSRLTVEVDGGIVRVAFSPRSVE